MAWKRERVSICSLRGNKSALVVLDVSPISPVGHVQFSLKRNTHIGTFFRQAAGWWLRRPFVFPVTVGGNDRLLARSFFRHCFIY